MKYSMKRVHKEIHEVFRDNVKVAKISKGTYGWFFMYEERGPFDSRYDYKTSRDAFKAFVAYDRERLAKTSSEQSQK